MTIPHDWKTIRIPAGVTVGILVAAASVFTYMHSTFALAADLVKQETKALSREQRSLEDAVFELEVKQEVAPQNFNAVDRKVLERKKQRLTETKQEIDRVRTTGKVSD